MPLSNVTGCVRQGFIATAHSGYSRPVSRLLYPYLFLEHLAGASRQSPLSPLQRSRKHVGDPGSCLQRARALRGPEREYFADSKLIASGPANNHFPDRSRGLLVTEAEVDDRREFSDALTRIQQPDGSKPLRVRFSRNFRAHPLAAKVSVLWLQCQACWVSTL